MIRLASRGSELALAQTRRVQELLDVESEVEVVESTGDRFSEADYSELGTQGVFVRELDLRVSDGDLDAAVHSMKDMPTERPEGLVIAAVLERDTPYDVLVTPDGSDLDELGEDMVVGTSSMRRQAQIRRYRADLGVEGLRGNVPTRIEKLREGEYDAIVLSAAGLERLELDVEYVVLDPDHFVPSPNQGTIAVVAQEDTEALDLLHGIDDRRARVETTAERRVLARVGGGCIVPLGVLARIHGEDIVLRAEVLSLDGEREAKLERRYPLENYLEGAEAVADELLDGGADDLLEEAVDA